METKLGGKQSNNRYGSDSKGKGKRSVEWDSNDWRWDGDLFMAVPVNSVPSDSNSRQLFPVHSYTPVKSGASNGFLLPGSEEVLLGDDREQRDSDMQMKCAEVNEHVNAEAGSLNLNLGEQVFPLMEREVDKGEERSGKKTKVASSRSVCQVKDCRADLSSAKDYHRRHKVCDVHSKATRALVGNVVQRFCQQCSRFHVVEEFDEGKRSCRRRLAGHNKRRRKTHPDNADSAISLNNEQGTNYLLASLLRICLNIQASSSDQAKDQTLFNLVNVLRDRIAGSTNEKNPTGLEPLSPDLQNVGTSLKTALKESTSLAVPGVTIPLSNFTQTSTLTVNAHNGATQNASAPQQPPLLFAEKASNLSKSSNSDATVERIKLNYVDLNHVYDDSQDCMDDPQNNFAPENVGCTSTVLHSQRFSTPHNSLGSSPSQSPSSSSGEAQSRTDRIVFKLFGKDPSDLPPDLREQVLDWLSNCPTNIESFIRPGCVILTMYICMDKNAWDELHRNFNYSLKRLIDSSTDSFWRTGWIYSRVRHRATFICDGQVVLDTPWPHQTHRSCTISSITPIAVSLSASVHFVVKGFNFTHSTSRLFCGLEGEYLVQESCTDLMRDSRIEHEEMQSLSFSCDMPSSTGRGFIEVEDHGLSNSFFPFIVAEDDVCSEIRNLESIVEVTEAAYGDTTNSLEARNRALDFVHEMGWLLHKNNSMLRLGATRWEHVGIFPFKRFRWLIEFAIEHDWCAVVKKLLSILFDGAVDAGQQSIIEALLDIGLLHQAVGKKSKPMVKSLLEYQPSGAIMDKIEPKKKNVDESRYLFRPDNVGAGGLTPLHLAASLDSCENVLDALTEDPGSVGIGAWKNARDSTGLTPHDYACLRGQYSYIHLLEKKLNKRSGKGQFVVDIPDNLLKLKIPNSTRLGYFETEKTKMKVQECRQCKQKLGYGNSRVTTAASVRLYRPAMLAIAAVCVCAALLFKSSPEVLCSSRPFRWELLKYGSQ